MMKNPRKVSMDSSPPPLPVDGDAIARYKHHALFQDYRELLRETEAKRRKLQKAIEKKLKLTAEVRFLRKKHESFARIPRRPKKSPRKMPSTATDMNNGDLTTKDQNQRAREDEAPGACALFDLNKDAEEMDAVQAGWEAVDKLKICAVDGGAIAHDSVYQDVGNGRGHVGKRKISWPDHVALRV